MLPELPSTLLPVSFVLALALILDSDAVQVIFQDQRSISEMRFRLPASLGDGISLPHHQTQALGSFALLPENRSTSYSSSPSTTMVESGLSSLSNSSDRWNLSRIDT